MLLFAVVLQTMKEYAWKADRLAVLLPDCVMLLVAEVLVDWVCSPTKLNIYIYILRVFYSSKEVVLENNIQDFS